MTQMNTQQQTDKYIEATSEFIKYFNECVKSPQKNIEEQFVRLMKYMTRVVNNTKPKEPVANQFDIPKRRGGRPKRNPDAELKKYKDVYDPEYQKQYYQQNLRCDVPCDVCQRQLSKTNWSKHKNSSVNHARIG